MAYDTEVLADSPVHYWKLDETSGGTATDSGSTPSTGTYNGGIVRGEPGLVGERTCPRFDGVDDHVGLDTGTNLLGSSQQITIELWFKTADVDVVVPAILFEVGGKGRGAAIYVYNGQLYAGITNSNTYQYVTTPVQSNTTYHVVLLVDGPASTIKLYLNASLAGTGSATAPSNWGGNISGIGGPNDQIRTHLGTAIGTDATYFNGWIDEVALYTTLLSESRIQAHYNAGVGGGQTISESIGLGIAAGVSPSATASAIDAVSLSKAFGAFLTAKAIVQESISVATSTDILDSSSATANETLTLGIALSLIAQETSGFLVTESIVLGMAAQIGAEATATAKATLALSESLGLSLSEKATATDAVLLAARAAIAASSRATVTEILTIASSYALNAYYGNIISEAIGLAHTAGLDVSAAATARADVTIALAASLVNAARALAEAGVGVGSVIDITIGESAAAVRVELPSGRTLYVRADPRTYYIRKQDRTDKVK